MRLLAWLAATALLGAASMSGAQAFDNVPFSYGHYCGVGHSQTGTRPVDALDAACMAHDQCADRADDGLACGCHKLFERRAVAIARDPRWTPTVRALASNMAGAVSQVPCDGDQDDD